jgi:NADH:ubiquinone oxidoreductase subunit 6 (subunit J)
MKLQTVAKLMIAIGVAVVLYALSMPVSIGYSEVVNIHLMNERQNTLIIGGLMFIAGIVLFATYKVKQTKEEANAAIADAVKTRQFQKEKVEQVGKQIRSKAKPILISVGTLVMLVIAISVWQDASNASQAKEEAKQREAEWQRIENAMKANDQKAKEERLAKEQVPTN